MNSNLLSAIFLTFIGGSFCSVGLAENIADATSSDEFCTQIKDDQGKLNSSRYVTIGGMDQWVAIKGTKCANPIVLMVHGGPGNPLSLYHDSLFQRWEREFTIVHWDQRGSGKTYEANQDIGELTSESLAITELTTDLLVGDGLELTDYIRKKFDREKIIISGTSWGSVLAIKMAFSKPQKYDFYIGVSQLVNYSKNMAASYNLVKEKATKMDDQVAIDALSDIGPPPWRDPRSFGKLRKIMRAYEYSTVSQLPELKVAPEYLSEKTRAAYFSGEEFSFVKFVGLKGDGMAQAIALDECCTELKIPIYLIQGEHDLLTTPAVTKAYFDKIKAPSKEYILIKIPLMIRI